MNSNTSFNNSTDDESFASAQGANSLVNKIRGLFRLADPTRGASPEEAKTALAKAQELMTKHGIEMATVGDHDDQGFNKPSEGFKFGKETFNTGRQRYEQDRYIYWILERCFGVKCYFSTYGERSSTGSWVSRHSYILVGEELDREVAKLVIAFLHPTMRRSYLDFCKVSGRKFSVADAHAHYRGIQEGYLTASEQGQALARSRVKKADADAYALVLVDKNNALMAYVEDVMTNVGKGRRTRANFGSQESYASGHRTGSSLDINVGSRLA